MTTSNVSSGQSLPGLVASAGDVINVLSGGTITNAAILAGGTATISVGGLDSDSVISAGGVELVYGSATENTIAGSQTVSTGTTAGFVSNETVVNGGVVYLAVKTTSAANITLDNGGTLNINGAISASNITLSGGTVDLQSPKATLTGTLAFVGGGELLVTSNTSAGNGDLAVITGFGAGSVINITAATTLGAAATATLSTATSSGNTIATVSGGGVSNSYIFSGTSIAASLVLSGDGAGGREITFFAAPSVTSVCSGSSVSDVTVSSGAPLTVYSGGTVVNTAICLAGQPPFSPEGLIQRPRFHPVAVKRCWA
jgi:hypothetical protein